MKKLAYQMYKFVLEIIITYYYILSPIQLYPSTPHFKRSDTIS